MGGELRRALRQLERSGYAGPWLLSFAPIGATGWQRAPSTDFEGVVRGLADFRRENPGHAVLVTAVPVQGRVATLTVGAGDPPRVWIGADPGEMQETPGSDPR